MNPPTAPRLAVTPLAVIALAYFALEFLLNGFAGYGYFNDELYYIACSKRLAWGFVDHPPLAPFLLRGVRGLLGDSLAAIRLLPALAGAATVFLAGDMARRFGGGRRAQVLASLAMAVAPGPLVLFGFFSTNAFEILLWAVCADLLLALLSGADERLWIVLGVAAGLGLENKHTMVLFGTAMAAALVLTSARREMRTPWPWLGLMASAVVILPNLLWEFRHDWISLEFYRTADRVKNVPTTHMGAAFDQALFMNPVLAPLWIAGLWFLLSSRWRALGVACLLLLALVVIVPASRPDRIAGIYPCLLAAGAVALAQSGLRRLRAGYLALVGVATAVMAPLALPILSPMSLADYAAALHVNPQIEIQRASRVPQWVADRLGWPDLAASIAKAFDALPAGERGTATFLAGDYGYAGAVEMFVGPKVPLRVIGTHNQYFLWGPGEPPPGAVVTFGVPRDALDRLFADVRQAAVFHCDFCYQDAMPIWIARQPRISLGEAWPALRHFE